MYFVLHTDGTATDDQLAEGGAMHSQSAGADPPEDDQSTVEYEPGQFGDSAETVDYLAHGYLSKYYHAELAKDANTDDFHDLLQEHHDELEHAVTAYEGGAMSPQSYGYAATVYHAGELLRSTRRRAGRFVVTPFRTGGRNHGVQSARRGGV